MVSDFLRERVDRAREAFQKGNRLGSAYLATIAGIWTSALKRPNVNPFETQEDDIWLYKWFANGYEDYTRAIGMNLEIRRKMLEAEKAWAEEKGTKQDKTQSNVKKQTSKWNVKLW
jgi:hypothetical protein